MKCNKFVVVELSGIQDEKTVIEQMQKEGFTFSHKTLEGNLAFDYFCSNEDVYKIWGKYKFKSCLPIITRVPENIEDEQELNDEWNTINKIKEHEIDVTPHGCCGTCHEDKQKLTDEWGSFLTDINKTESSHGCCGYEKPCYCDGKCYGDCNEDSCCKDDNLDTTGEDSFSFSKIDDAIEALQYAIRTLESLKIENKLNHKLLSKLISIRTFAEIYFKYRNYSGDFLGDLDKVEENRIKYLVPNATNSIYLKLLLKNICKIVPISNVPFTRYGKK